MSFMTFLQHYIDYIVLGLLALMSFIMFWAVIERFSFFKRVDVQKYDNEYDLDIDLTRNLTTISTVGANAPYVGLLGTVVGILLTFYDLGNSGGDINAASIMVHLSLALKATGVGILVAIPAMVFYSALGRKVEVCRLKWQAMQQKPKTQDPIQKEGE